MSHCAPYKAVEPRYTYVTLCAPYKVAGFNSYKLMEAAADEDPFETETSITTTTNMASTTGLPSELLLGLSLVGREPS
eukprot:5585016-Pyramimonas_sp.AAC.2